MKKLADISQFESLANSTNFCTLSVFNGVVADDAFEEVMNDGEDGYSIIEELCDPYGDREFGIDMAKEKFEIIPSCLVETAANHLVRQRFGSIEDVPEFTDEDAQWLRTETEKIVREEFEPLLVQFRDFRGAYGRYLAKTANRKTSMRPKLFAETLRLAGEVEYIEGEGCRAG